jgi:hypothetical protein
MSEHHDAVKLLLARMESHPEEFAGITMTREQDRLYTSRWGTLVTQFWHVLTSEEQAALNNALVTANRNNFHSEVMKELLDPRDSRAGKQMELFPAQTAYPPGGKPTKLLTHADISEQALKILKDEFERDRQRQRGR